MSYYYEYNFTSPDKIYAIVKEELKSYFDTGAIDDLMFPTYVDKCLRNLGRSTYVMSRCALCIDDFQSRLPDNFYAVREAWLCAEIEGPVYQSPSSFYSQTATATAIQIAPLTIAGQPCTDPVCPPKECDECMPTLVQAVFKINHSINQMYARQFLLTPGTISAKSNCRLKYKSVPYASTYNSFDIRDNKFVTNFRNGIVDLVFYATEYDDVGNQLIPDNYSVMEYIEAYIKFKVFETLSNQTMDETFNQMEKKLEYYKHLSDEALIEARMELRRQTIWEKQRRIKRDLKRFDKYEIYGSTNRMRK